MHKLFLIVEENWSVALKLKKKNVGTYISDTISTIPIWQLILYSEHIQIFIEQASFNIKYSWEEC